jgi:hypothetical protein
VKYASFLTISRALHPDVFDQPENNYFFNNPLDTASASSSFCRWYSW